MVTTNLFETKSLEPNFLRRLAAQTDGMYYLDNFWVREAILEKISKSNLLPLSKRKGD